MVHVVMKNDANVTHEDSVDNHAATKACMGDDEYLLFVDARLVRSFSRDARVYTASQEARKNTTKQAVLIRSGVSKMIGNLFIIAQPPVCPTRLFTSEADALAWLVE